MIFYLVFQSCENALQNAPSEANLLLDAARCFIDAEKLNEELLCPSYHEHVTAAVNCYSHAFRVSYLVQL